MDQNKKAGHFDEKMLNPKVKSEDGECQMSAKYDNEEKHPTWSRHAEFFFCTLGGCVGFGNLWRFPYLCMRNGGGAFLIPYILFLVICAIPMVYMESLLGQFSGYGYLAQWNICPLFKGAGHLSTLLNLTWLVYFAVIVAWSLYYVGSSFAPNVPWATCDNEWNTPSCWDFSNNTAPASNLSTELAVNRSALGVSYLRENASSINGSSVFVVKRTTPAEEFFENNVLQMTDRIEDIGSIRWELLGCLFAAWVLTIVCIIKGIRTSGKVAYVTAGAPYILLTVLLVRGVTLPGAMEGIKFYVTPDFKRLTELKVWGEACVQVFLSFTVCCGYFTTLNSFNKFKNNCCRDAILIPILSGSTSILAGFVVFSAMGFMAGKMGVEVSEVTKAGPSLAFVAYPEALRQLPIAPMWSILFFLTVILLGIDSGFALIECIVTSLADEFRMVRRHKTITTISIGMFLFLLGIPMVTKGGIYILTFIDWYGFIFCQLLVGLCECIAVGWVYGPTKLNNNIRDMLDGNPGSIWWTTCWRFISPFTMVFMIVFNALTLSTAKYGDYVFPKYVAAMGIFFCVGELFIVPGVMVYRIRNTPGTLLERIRTLLQPSSKWRKQQGDDDVFMETRSQEVMSLKSPYTEQSNGRHADYL